MKLDLRWYAAISLFFLMGGSTDAVNNEAVLSYPHINTLFTELGLTTCESKRNPDLWKSLLAGEQITPCEPPSVPFDPKAVVPSQDSGIVVGNGQRTLHNIKLRDCQNKIHWLRWTYDFVQTPKGPICGFEFFVKTPEGNIIGVGLDKDGKILKEVPRELAFDKHRNKTSDTQSEVITSGQGCFHCHPTVSSEYGMVEHRKFWGALEKADQARKGSPAVRTPRGH